MRDSGTIQIMRDGFQPDQLDRIVEALKEDGYTCALFTGCSEIGAAFSNPQTRLLLAAAGADTTQLVDAIKSHRSEYDVPVLVYLSQPGPDAFESVLPEVDDFLLAPLSVRDLRLRVNRLTFGLASSARAQENLISDLAAQQFIGSAPSFLAVVEKIPRSRRPPLSPRSTTSVCWRPACLSVATMCPTLAARTCSISST